MQLTLLLTAFLIVGAFAVPSFAQTTNLTGNLSQTGIVITPGQTNYTYVPVSGTVSFDPSNYNNLNSATQLTIYANYSVGGGNHTNPDVNGNFVIMVPTNSTASIFVYPSKLDYLNKSTNATYSVMYPTMESPYQVNVTTTGVSGVVIPTQTIQTGIEMNATPLPPTVTTAAATATPTPGFTAIGALAMVGLVAAIIYSRKQ
jgi:hypothetical protein